MEVVWQSNKNKLTENKVIIEFLTCLNSDESKCFIDALEALYLTSELTHLCRILLRLEDILQAVNAINWPNEINDEVNHLVLALGKIKQQDYFKIKLKQEHLSIRNHIYGRMEEYPVVALFCQQFGLNIKDNQKPLLFLLNFMLFQIARHDQSKKDKKSSILTNAANTLRKIIACDTRFDRNIPLEKVTFEKLNKLLLALTHDNHINFQEQFLRAWSQLYQDKPFVRTIKPSEPKRPRKHTGKVSANNLQKPVNENFQLDNGIAIKTDFISVIPDKNNSDDIDDTVIDIIEVITPDDIEFDHRTKNAASIYGSRLSLTEKKHLPWRSNVLAKHEVSELVKYLKYTLLDDSDPMAILVSLVLLTSKPYAVLLNMKIFASSPSIAKQNNDFIELSTGTWWRRSVDMPGAFKSLPEQKHLLAKHSDWLALPLPQELIDAINKHYANMHITIAQLCFKDSIGVIEGELSAFLKPLWQNNSQLHRRITPAAVRATLFESATSKFDSGYAALMLANTEFDTPTTLYYLSASCAKLKADYLDVVGNIGFKLSTSINADDHVVGSQLVINKTEISKIIASKKIAVQQLITAKTPSFEEIIIRHNQFVSYTLLVLVAATGHRSRSEFGFSPYTNDDEMEFSLIADKINFVDSAIRILPQSLIVQKQMLAYKNHCADISRLVKPYSLLLATALSKASKLQVNNEPTFFHLDKNSLIPVGQDALSHFLKPEINLPVNFLRHSFCSALRLDKTYQYAKGLMGHIGSGEHLLADHSCSALIDLKIVANTIDIALKNIGIDAIDFLPPKGPKIDVSTENIKTPYRPSYLQRNEVTERANQIRWIRKLISPEIKALLNPDTHQQTVDNLLKKVITDHDCAITVGRRLYWLNRITAKISQNKRWVSVLNEAETLAVETDLFLKTRQAHLIKSTINQWLLSNDHTLTNTEILAKIWSSLVINSAMDVPINLANLTIISQSPFYEHGIAWFELINNTKKQKQVVYIDSISLLLIQKHSIADVKIKSTIEIKKYIYQHALRLISKSNQLDYQAKQALKNIDTVGDYLRSARDVSTISLLHAYQNNRLLTTDLSSEKFCRWLSAKPIVFEGASTEPSLLIPFSTSVLSNTSNSNYKSSLLLVALLHRKLSQLKKTNSHKKLTSIAIIQTWATFINLPNETHVEHLIQQSKQLSEMMILILLWLIAVGKRPGRGKRKNTAVGTVKTYLSNIAKPLLEQSINCSILTMEAEEINELYNDALDSRNLKDRAQRAENMRNFHNFVMEAYQCSPVDWYDIEPSINNNECAADANLISIREYEQALFLLKNDLDMTKNEQNINQILLILCYRAGLRSGEATNLTLNDIDNIHWIIHVRTNASRRTKTLKSNRRVPVALLLSTTEKQLINGQIKLVKQHHPDAENPWLFSDNTSPLCLVYIDKHTARVSEAIRAASGDKSLRLHHARHSFANYLLLLMNKLFVTESIFTEVKSWCRTNDVDEFSHLMHQQLTSEQAPKENILHAISLAMGHASPETTLRSYIHLLNIMSVASNEKYLHLNIDIKSMAKIAGVDRSHAYKILTRADPERYGFIPLCKYSAKQWIRYQQLASCRTQNSLPLSRINADDINRCCLELNNIERIIRAAERGKLAVEIANDFRLSFPFVQTVIKTTIQLKRETAYMGTSISSDLAYIIFAVDKNKHQTSAKYIKQADFQVLLTKVAKLSKQQKQTLSQLWRQNYTVKYGLIIDEVSLEQMKVLFPLIDYRVSDTKQEVLVSEKSSKRKGTVIKLLSKKSKNVKNNDNKIHHAIFLLSIWLIAK